MESETADALIAAFQRSPNYPRDDDGVMALANGLKRASEQTGVPMRAIVRRCVAESLRCPTDAEMLNTAHGLKAPAPFATADPRKCPMGTCDGYGWQIKFWLWTFHRNRVEKTEIGEAEFYSIPVAIAGSTPDPKRIRQETYSDARRCQCSPAPTPAQEEHTQRKRGGSLRRAAVRVP